MNFQKSNIEKCFSTEELINILSEIEPTENAKDINVEIEFKDAIVEMSGRLWGHFDKQELTHDSPQYTDLYDVGIEFSLVKIYYNTEYFEKKVRSLMLN